jgi:ATP-dependent Lon protease
MLFRNDKRDNRDASSNETVALLPLRELIVFPHEVYAILVGRQKSIKALEAAESGKRPILLAVQKDAGVFEPGPDDIYAVGTLGVVVQLLRLPDGTVKALLEGKTRARIIRYASQDEFFQVEVEEIEEVCERTTEVEALMRLVNATFDNYVRLNEKIPPEMVTSIASVDDPAYLADKLVGHLGIKLEDKQSLLECTNPAERLERILGYMRSELEILEVETRIRSRVKKQIEMTQKEYYLNEQMRAIQEELGEKDEFKNESQELENKLRQKKMPAEAREKCEREIKKLKMMSPMSPEAPVVRNYLDWFLALPWFEYTEDKLDIQGSRAHPRRGSLRAREGQAAHPRVISPSRPWSASSRGRSCAWWDRRASARPRWANRWRGRPDASLCGSRWVACATRPKFAAIAGPTSARCPAR